MKSRNTNLNEFHVMSLPERVAADVRRMIISSMEPGQRLETEPKLAKRFGVSLGTLRAGVEMLQAEGLLVRRQGSGTYVTSRLDKPIAILVDQDISQWNFSYFYRRIILRLAKEFNRRSVPHRFYLGTRTMKEKSGPLSCTSFLHDLAHNRFAGVVEGATPPHESWLPELEKREIPIVGIWGYENFVCPDIRSMMREGIQALADQGCERIALLNWGNTYNQNGTNKPWLASLFEQMVQFCGLNPKDCFAMDAFPQEPGSGWRAMMQLKEEGYFSGKIDGLFFTDDMFFSDAVLGLVQMGVDIPGQLKVASSTNRGAPYNIPFPVTKLEIDADDVGKLMAEMVIGLVNKEPDTHTKIRVPCRVLLPQALVSPVKVAAI